MNSIQSFVKLLDQQNDLKRIGEFVSTDLEITEIADREMKTPGGGKALLFENNGTKYPLLINMLGSNKRIAQALYCNDPSDKSEEMHALFQALAAPKKSLGDKLKTLPILGDISSYFPKYKSGRGKCQEVVDSTVDIFSLPVLKCWPHDGGRFITFPMVNTIDPETGIRNVGMYRVQLLDSNTTAMHWHLHKTGARHYAQYKRLGRKMPCAIVLGGDPVYTYCATAPLPDGIDEYLLAGFLRKKAVRLVKCITQPDIMVPDDADFVIEGYLDPEEDLILEGPFGDHTGFYSLADYYPKFHITCITHRSDAIYPCTIVGVPPMEDAYISSATEKIFRFPITMAFAPEMEDLHMPPAGVEHNITIVKIRNQYQGNALKIKNAMWGAGQMMFNKILVVYSGNQQLTDYESFVRDALNNFDPQSDAHIEKSGVSDVLDHSSRRFACGGKLCLDCTGKEDIDAHKYTINEIDTLKILKKYPSISKIDQSLIGKGIQIVFIIVNNKNCGSIKSLAHSLVETEGLIPKLLVFVDEGLPDGDYNLLAWYAAGNIDPSRDCYLIDNCLCVDSTAKTFENDGFTRQWPEVVSMDQKTIDSVNQKKCMQISENLLISPSIKLHSLRLNDGAVKFFNSKTE